MKIGDMFLKSIDRDIKGVIKVGQDDGANIYQELDEYVVTKELSKHFSEFFQSYKNGITGTTDKMGVWISGFFGSGKSHFLKILSYLLNNVEVDGKKAIDFFAEGNKISDSIVMGDIKLAGDVSTDVILFNIDSKSAAKSKASKDAIVEVFIKVFNEMQGYCSSMPFLADFERKLNDDGNYAAFKAKFEEISGNNWVESREDFYFIQDDLIKTLTVLDIMSEEAARNWCEKSSDTYNLDIENFAKLVAKYCEKKGKGHHVVFLVDEIGQYIAEDTNLMLNLQTITEQLGIQCGGKVWVIVTSQQDIDSFTKVKGNDFSKIQGRFDTRLSLSSANVDEVIRKRILAKNDTATQTLTLLYDRNESVLKNLIIFTSDTANKKLYADRYNFAEVYPFIPYQFNLLGQVLTAIRTHGASGKHLAEGERSMIALFKESAARFKNYDTGILMPFNVFYNALDKFIDHTHRIVISQASENSVLEPFDVELLKVLFMIKYVKEIKANTENLTTLMVSNINDDRIALRKKIEDSLNRLIKETLVQKSGDTFMFLTNEEQDIEKAIQNETYEIGEIITEASNVIFQELITEAKFRYNARYNFPYNQIVDDRFYKNNQSNGMGLKFITPYNDNINAYTPESLRMLSASESNVIVLFPNDTTFLEEITSAIQISKYITKQGSMQTKSLEAIKRAKQDEYIDKRTRIKIFIENAIKNADIYVNGDKLNISAKDPQSRITEAMGKLVNTIYNKLSYMETSPTYGDLESIFVNDNQLSLTGIPASQANKLALEDVITALDLNASRHIKTTLKSLMDRFSAPPYGFVDLDIEWLVLTLFKQGKITMSINSQTISTINTRVAEILKYVTKKEFVEKIVIEKRISATSVQIKTIKQVMKDLFGITAVSEEDDALISSFKTYANNKLKEIKDKLVEYRIEARYPGQSTLQDAQKSLDNLIEIDNPSAFFKAIENDQEDLQDLAEDIIPVLAFFDSEQKTIFGKTLKYIDIFEHSKTFVTDAALISVVDGMRQITKKSAPYNEIHKLPELNERFSKLHVDLLEKEAEPIKADLENDKKEVLAVLSTKEFEDKFKAKFLGEFDELRNRLETSNEVAKVKNIRLESDALKIRCLDEIEVYEKSITLPPMIDDGEIVKPVVTKTTKNISMKQMAATVVIEKDEDIDKFLNELRAKLKSQLSENTILKLMM